MSPGEAAFMAAWRSPPAGTTIVAAKVAEAEINRIEEMTKAFISSGPKQRIAAHFWEIDTFAP